MLTLETSASQSFLVENLTRSNLFGAKLYIFVLFGPGNNQDFQFQWNVKLYIRHVFFSFSGDEQVGIPERLVASDADQTSRVYPGNGVQALICST